MKLSERIQNAVQGGIVNIPVLVEWQRDADRLEERTLAARAIMEKFVNKVDTGRARSKETYAEMTEWLGMDLPYLGEDYEEELPHEINWGD